MLFPRILACRRRAGHSLNVEMWEDRRRVPAYHNIREVHQTAAQNVLSTQTVLMSWLVSMKNVWIPVRAHVE